MKRGRPAYPDVLTPREWEVLACIREGLTNEEIAARLGISESGARYHVSEILGKLSVRNRREAADYTVAPRRGWLGLPFLAFPEVWTSAVRKWAGVAAVASGGAAAMALVLLVVLPAFGGGSREEAAPVVVATQEKAIAPDVPPNQSVPNQHQPVPGPRGRQALQEGPIPPLQDGLVFASLADGNWNLFVMNRDGSGRTRLTSDPAMDTTPHWSPDGTKIVFRSEVNLYNTDIFILNADGSVTNASNDPLHDQEPYWSPDGKKITFHSSRHGPYNSEIYIMNADGSQPMRLTENLEPDFGPVWSPDGKQIVFYRYIAGTDIKSSELFVMSADGSGEKRLTQNRWFDGNPAWSPNGRQIAYYSEGDFAPGVYVISASGGTPELIAPQCREPAWSPDGKKIACSGIRTRGPDILLFNADGTGGEVNLTNDGGGHCCPHWLP